MEYTKWLESISYERKLLHNRLITIINLLADSNTSEESRKLLRIEHRDIREKINDYRRNKIDNLA